MIVEKPPPSGIAAAEAASRTERYLDARSHHVRPDQNVVAFAPFPNGPLRPDGSKNAYLWAPDLLALLRNRKQLLKHVAHVRKRRDQLAARVEELEAELAGFETVWGVRYGVAKTGISEDEPDTYTTERESEADARLWRDDYAPHGEIVTCRVSPWRTVDEEPATPAQAAG